VSEQMMRDLAKNLDHRLGVAITDALDTCERGDLRRIDRAIVVLSSLANALVSVALIFELTEAELQRMISESYRVVHRKFNEPPATDGVRHGQHEWQ
jgi:hypothetical protein